MKPNKSLNLENYLKKFGFDISEDFDFEIYWNILFNGFKIGLIELNKGTPEIVCLSNDYIEFFKKIPDIFIWQCLTESNTNLFYNSKLIFSI